MFGAMNIHLSDDAAQRLTALAVLERRSAQAQAEYILERQLKRSGRAEPKRIETREPEPA